MKFRMFEAELTWDTPSEFFKPILFQIFFDAIRIKNSPVHCNINTRR
jgi:hypothetical protein